MRIFALICMFFLAMAFATASVAAQEGSRGSIPEELLRPKRGEAPRYPVDTVIGELGQGRASNGAYSFARSIASGLLSGEMGHQNLADINSVTREGYLSALGLIRPSSYRLGGGREEPDGAFSFMIRFVGREQGITGELYVRYVTRQTEREIKIETAAKIDDIEFSDAISEEEEYAKVEISTTGRWAFDDLILEEARSKEEEKRDEIQRFDFLPYERFF